jgi:CBS domain-containing protein
MVPSLLIKLVMMISQIMTTHVHTCGPDDRLNVPAQIMWDHDCGCVPVVDADRRVIGMITDRDICMAAHTQARAPQEIPTSEVMAKRLVVCRLSHRIESVEQLMMQARVHRLPVLDDDDHLVGIVSLNDLAVRATIERSHGVRGVADLEQVALTLAVIGEHRAPSTSPIIDQGV